MAATYHDLAGTTVFVSGGATGIGEEIVRAFHGQGCLVVFADIADAAGRDLETELAQTSSGGLSAPVFVECDVTDDEALCAAVDTAEELGAGLEVLVNNAANDTRVATDEVDGQMWDAAVAVNLKHQFVAAQRAAGYMRARGRGSIINFGSVAPVAKVPDLVVYNTCKAAVRGLTRSLAKEYGRDHVRVNTIVPGSILTQRQLELWFRDDAAVGRVLAQQCIPRRMHGSDIAQMALFLASEVSSGCTAQEWIVDAGLI